MSALEAYSSFHINLDNERLSIVNEEFAIKNERWFKTEEYWLKFRLHPWNESDISWGFHTAKTKNKLVIITKLCYKHIDVN